MKNLKINVPEGMEIEFDKENGVILFNKKEERDLPLSVKDISKREWTIHRDKVKHMPAHTNDKNQLSTKERAEAHLALMQLVELRDVWNGEWRADWTRVGQEKSYIGLVSNKIDVFDALTTSHVLHFKSIDLAERFLKQFQDLIETAKELL